MGENILLAATSSSAVRCAATPMRMTSSDRPLPSRSISARERLPHAHPACRLIFILVQSEHLGRLRSEAAEFFIGALVLVHPLCCPVVPLAGFFLVAELFV